MALKLRRVTLEQVCSMQPCWLEPPDHSDDMTSDDLIRLAGRFGPGGATARDVLTLRGVVSDDDLAWLLDHSEWWWWGARVFRSSPIASDRNCLGYLVDAKGWLDRLEHLVADLEVME